MLVAGRRQATRRTVPGHPGPPRIGQAGRTRDRSPGHHCLSRGTPGGDGSRSRRRLANKAAYAAAAGAQMWIVTQFVFDPAPAIHPDGSASLTGLPASGAHRCGWTGGGPRTLLEFAVRCGVGTSVKMLRRQPNVTRLLNNWTPDGPAVGPGPTSRRLGRDVACRHSPVHLRRTHQDRQLAPQPPRSGRRARRRRGLPDRRPQILVTRRPRLHRPAAGPNVYARTAKFGGNRQ